MRTIIVPALATMLLAFGPATAQESQEGQEAQPEQQGQEGASMSEQENQEMSRTVMSEQQSEELRGDWLLGTRIQSAEGETIGSIEELIIDQQSGSVTAAVVSVGGFLGIGAKQIAVDWKELQIEYDGNIIEVNLTRDQASEAEEYAFRERQTPPPPEPPADTGGTGGRPLGTVAN